MVFMMTKQFPSDQGFNTDAAELSKLPPPPPQPPSECPRCGSINTKFCYYNNYNKSQPRHFCKSCKRHWTKGGTLRNIPAGRRRTNKRPRTSAAAAAAVKAEPQKKHNLENLLSLSTDQKNMSNILYQALIHSSSPSTSIPLSTILESNGTTHSAGLNASAPQNRPNTEFTFSSFTSLISNPTSDYYQSSNDYNVDNSAEESTVTTSAAPPWPAVSTAADVWSWNDGVDLMGDLNTVWDHLTFLEGSYPR